MFIFIKKIFYIGSLFLSSLVSTISLNCVSMESQVRPENINVNSTMNLYFILLVLKQINVAVVVTALMTHMQKYVFLML